MEQSHGECLRQGEIDSALRVAFWLGLMLRNNGKKAMSNGWLARGERILKETHSEAESVNGLFLIPHALEALGSGNPYKARELFEQATMVGVRSGDASLKVLGRLGLGQTFIVQSEVLKGLRLLDEMMVTVQSEEVYPVVNGIVYCAVIEMCRKVWDIRRAKEWTSELTRWCEEQPGIVPFKGQCLIHRSEIYQLYGDWIKALEEIKNACAWLTAGLPAAGEAYYRKAELLRLKGDFKDAHDGYLQASKLGRRPQPGLALLHLAKGQRKEAVAGIQNALNETSDKRKRAELLPVAVTVMLSARQMDEAKKASEEMLSIATECDVPYLTAMAAHGAGQVAFETGEMKQALKYLQEALPCWHTLHFPYETARSRELKGRIYSALGDASNAESEFEAAKWTLQQLQAIPDLARVEQLLTKKKDHNNYGLTLREMQVLDQIALGKTNRLIAASLFISERTVDRHVSNLFNKLGVSSRVSAITFALQNNLVEQPA